MPITCKFLRSSSASTAHQRPRPAAAAASSSDVLLPPQQSAEHDAEHGEFAVGLIRVGSDNTVNATLMIASDELRLRLPNGSVSRFPLERIMGWRKTDDSFSFGFLPAGLDIALDAHKSQRLAMRTRESEAIAAACLAATDAILENIIDDDLLNPLFRVDDEEDGLKSFRPECQQPQALVSARAYSSEWSGAATQMRLPSARVQRQPSTENDPQLERGSSTAPSIVLPAIAEDDPDHSSRRGGDERGSANPGTAVHT